MGVKEWRDLSELYSWSGEHMSVALRWETAYEVHPMLRTLDFKCQ